MDQIAFPVDLSWLALADLPEGIANGLLLDVIGFFFICTLAIWPPPALTHCGLIFERLPRPCMAGTSLLRELELKTHFNRVYLSALPAIFLLYECISFGLLFHALLVIATFIQIQSVLFLYNCYKFARGKTRVASEFNIEEMRSIDQILSSRSFVTHPSYSNVVLLNDRFFINERRFGYSIERLADLKFSAIESTISVQGTDYLTILVENSKNGSSYKFRIHSNDLSSLREIVDVEMKCKSLYDRFVERFTTYIDGNPKFVMADTASFDPCFACYAKQPDVIIKKSCTGLYSPSTRCTSCACRPTWCASCLARVFAAAQPADRPSRWMDGTASCPTCRATFCANDVLFIVNEADL